MIMVVLDILHKRSTIARLLRLPEDMIRVFVGEQFHYRNRMDFTFHPTGLGLRKPGKWDHVLDISSSELANSNVNRLLSEVRAFVTDTLPFDTFDLRNKTGTFRYATIRAPSLSSSITFILSSESGDLAAAKERALQFSKISSADSVLVGFVSKLDDRSLSDQFEVIKGSVYLSEKINNHVFMFHSQAFFQNNSLMAEQMVSYVCSLFSQSSSRTLLDLYGGVGLFGISCAPLFDRVVVVESHPLSLDCAKMNAKQSAFSSVETYACEIESLRAASFYSSVVSQDLAMIVDPPRSGISRKALNNVLSLKPRTLVYISCNPLVFANELSSFSREGYLIKSCALFDMFPKTQHVEMIVELVLA